MEWVQVFIIIGSMAAAWYGFYNIADKRIDRMENHHREDMKKMDDKWERLFERLLIQDKQKRSES